MKTIKCFKVFNKFNLYNIIAIDNNMEYWYYNIFIIYQLKYYKNYYNK